MNARHSSTPAPGPDLLARYLNAYLHARQLSDTERPWGLGDDGLDSLWSRLTWALASDPQKLDRIVADELSETERVRIVETMTPLIFALPLRAYPAELRVLRAGPRLHLSLRHIAAQAGSDSRQSVGFLPAALSGAFAAYLRRMLRWPEERKTCEALVSSGGRRRRVRVTILARERGVVIRFLERVPSPADE